MTYTQIYVIVCCCLGYYAMCVPHARKLSQSKSFVEQKRQLDEVPVIEINSSVTWIQPGPLQVHHDPFDILHHSIV